MFKKIIIISTVSLVSFCAVIVAIFWSMANSNAEVIHPVDIIVSLGGGQGGRVGKAWDLQTKGYSRSDKQLVTGIPVNPEKVVNIHPRLKYLQDHPEIHYEPVYTNETKNTWEEILYIKQYMQKHGYRSVIIVTDPQHVARVRMTLDRVGHFKDAGLEYQVISYKKVNFLESFLNDKGFRDYALLEVVKRLGYEVKALGYNVSRFAAELSAKR